MPDELTENGLTVKTATELETELKEGFKEIYGKILILIVIPKTVNVLDY